MRTAAGKQANGMRKILGIALKWFYFQTAFFLLFSGYAHAYIDPSAVTYMIQALAAVAIAAGASFTVLRQRIVALFRGKKKAVKKAPVVLKTGIADKDLYEDPSPEDAA